MKNGFEIDRSLTDLERWWKGLESSEHELNPEASHSSKVNCYKQFVGRTLGFSLRKKNDFFAT